jgi:hypothetical protein
MIKRFLATTVVGGLLATAALVGSSPPTPVGATGCSSGAWSNTVGRPAEVAPSMTGAAVWRVADTDRFRFRVSEAGIDLARFRGSISTDGTVVAIGRHLEGGDLSVRLDNGRVVFAFQNRGGVDGFDLIVRCASVVRFNVRMNGEQLSPDQVVIGGDSAHPEATPFSIERVASP